MPKISRIELLKQREQPTLVIRTHTSIQDLPRLIGESYGKLGAYLQERGELLSDIPFVAYHNMDMQNLDVEIGFPVASPLPGKGEIQAGQIPEGKIVFCMYLGGYAEIGPVYEEMAKWITDKGLIPEGTAYEYYYNDPEFPENQLLTKIVMTVK